MANVLNKPIRYLWHFLGGLLLPLIYYLTDKKISLIIFGTFFLFFFLADLLRLHNSRLNEWIFKYLGTIIKEDERNRFSGNPYYISGAFLSVLLFEKGIAIASLCFVAGGDLAASLIGKKYGKIRIKKKSLEGGLGSLLTCLLIGIILLVLRLRLSFGILLIGALTASIVELFSPGRKDNLTVPLFSGLIMQIVRIL
jgi:dolichol kinase